MKLLVDEFLKIIGVPHLINALTVLDDFLLEGGYKLTECLHTVFLYMNILCDFFDVLGDQSVAVHGSKSVLSLFACGRRYYRLSLCEIILLFAIVIGVVFMPAG